MRRDFVRFNSDGSLFSLSGMGLEFGIGGEADGFRPRL